MSGRRVSASRGASSRATGGHVDSARAWPAALRPRRGEGTTTAGSLPAGARHDGRQRGRLRSVGAARPDRSWAG
jgi:hypothetical protein